MRHLFPRDWEQLNNLKELMFLTDLVFLGNPVEEEASEDGTYTSKVNDIHVDTNEYMFQHMIH